MNWMLMFYVTGTLCLTFWMAAPLLGSKQAITGEQDSLIQERTRSLLRALKKLYSSQGTETKGEDSANIERRLLLGLARIYQRQGISPATVTNTKKAYLQVDAEGPLLCPNCNTPVEDTYAFCLACGTKLMHSAK